MSIRKLILSASLVLSLSAAGYSQAAAAPEASSPSGKTAAVKESGTHFMADAVMPYIKTGECPGAISILYRDGVQETALLGYADMENQIPIRMDQMFMQCSQTKGFCGVTIAMLVEEGKLNLDDPVSKYLPEFAELKVSVKGEDGKTVLVPAKNTLTVRMVMNHTGGFPFEIPTKGKNGWPSLSLRETAKEAASRPLLFEPGTKVQYSNTGIDIGAAVTEVITGQGWDVFLAERVLKPLGMNSSTFNPTDEQLKDIILMYNVSGGKKAEFRSFHKAMPLPHNGPDIHPSAGAGLWTTAEDQYKFYKMLMNLGIGDNGVRILKEETVRSLLATSSLPAGLGKYSLGLSLGNGVMGHGGAFGTSADVNWQKRHLSIWIVQQVGNRARYPWNAARNKARAKFFSADTESAAEAYTGRYF